MSISIYHNPRCSKSRQTLQLLEQQQLTPQVIQYLDTPPDAATLSHLLDMLGLTPRELMRKGEAEYKASGADDPSLSREQLIALMVRFPKLIERPIVV
ncbi:MAG: arsenate reductase (glutaredoxin), partial [Gammaproteobacteria bacterium]|nr:arsenate reductase (glutaredoxin) [Gammaproteobacteria bacterium]